MDESSTPLMIYKITLLRHGESEGNAFGYYQGQNESPLTPVGEAQSVALARRWLAEGVCFDRIISSPQARARRTAEIIAEHLNAPLELDALWMERDCGLLTGLSHEQAEAFYPRPAFIHPYMHIGQTGESVWESYLRAGRGVQSLLDRPPGRYLVVAHGAILNMAMYAILGIAPQANFNGPRFRFRNTAFANLSYDPAGHEWTLESINDRAHWSDENDNYPRTEYHKE